MNVYKLLGYFVVSLFIAGCNSSTSEKEGAKAGDEIIAIKIPFREHGYHNFNTRVIDSNEDFNGFIADVEGQPNWNKKEVFLQQLQSQSIDFRKKNLLLYRLTEPSGSIKLSIEPPSYSSNNMLQIIINKDTPEAGTSDMAYYLLAYKIDKNISQLTFDDGKQKVIIENLAAVNVVPKNCLTWFDGCNTCGRLKTGEAVCTKIGCPANTIEEFSCKTWIK